MKKTLLALLVAGAAAQSQAAIQSGNPAGNNNVSGSELTLQVFDPVSLTTYVRDLGVDMAGFIATGNVAGTTLNWSASSLFGSSFAGADKSQILWQVISADTDATGSTATSATRGARSLVTTEGHFTGTLTNGQVAAGAANIDNFQQAIGTSVGTGTLASAQNGEAATTSDTYNWANNLNSNLVSQFTGSTATVLGSSMYMILNTQQSTSATQWRVSSGNGVFSEFAGLWNLDLNGNLSYSVAPVSNVPVPAAVWLLGSGLVGLVGVSRRRNEEQA